MPMQRISPASREEWLAARKEQGIGASEAASIVDRSPWTSKHELWEIKTGRKEPKDLSGNEAVERGIQMEDAIRTVFAAKHPELKVEHHAYDILFQEDRPWLFATLDGECVETETKKNCVLEIKTATPNGKAGWERWSDGKIPENYYIQILHQMLATGADKVFLAAFLYTQSEDIIYREYEFWREDCLDDLAWLLKEEEAFWKSVQSGQEPLKFTIFT